MRSGDAEPLQAAAEPGEGGVGPAVAAGGTGGASGKSGLEVVVTRFIVQVMPPGIETTVPVGTPEQLGLGVRVTSSRACCGCVGWKLAVTARARSMVSVQELVPLQSPDQPAKEN